MSEKESEEEALVEVDTDFLDQLNQIEAALTRSSSSSTPTPSSTNPDPNHNPNSSLPPPPPPPAVSSTRHTFLYAPAPPPPQQQQQQQCRRPSDDFSFSPPRELSQGSVVCREVRQAPPPPPRQVSHRRRKAGFVGEGSGSEFGFSNDDEVMMLRDDAKDLEIERLKKELGHASEQLAQLEHECSELRKESSEKEEQIAHALSTKKNSGYGTGEDGAHGLTKLSKETILSENQITCQSDTGVQTEKYSPPDHSDINEHVLGIWDATSNKRIGYDLISKLLMACPDDFHVLFGYMSLPMSSETAKGSTGSGSSFHAAPRHHVHSLPPSHATKVSHLYSVLTEVSNGLLNIEALFRPLLDLCDLQNVAICSSALRILQLSLKQFFSFKRSETRDNVRVEGLSSGDNVSGRSLFNLHRNEASHAGSSMFRCWVSGFQVMLQISVNATDSVNLEAVRVMNLIVMESNACTDRERLGQTAVFERIPQLLKSEAGPFVRKETLHLLYLLLNCPKLLSLFCSCCEDRKSTDCVKNEKNALTFKECSLILEGLADCIICYGDKVQDIEVCKKAIVLLAFLASFGRSGFEILVSHMLPGEANFIVLILQALKSGINREESVSSPEAGSITARTMLTREALILLNRLVSNSGYSASVLRILTGSRDITSLTIEIACKLTQHEWKTYSTKNHTRESEIFRLARIFKKRVYNYLGERLS